jgi:hypothetical protein
MLDQEVAEQHHALRNVARGRIDNLSRNAGQPIIREHVRDAVWRVQTFLGCTDAEVEAYCLEAGRALVGCHRSGDDDGLVLDTKQLPALGRPQRRPPDQGGE